MPVLIAIGGLSGSGKSTLARSLATERGVACIRSDVERKRLFGVAETDRLGPEGYASQVTIEIYRRFGELAAAELTVAKSVIIDAVFQRVHEREAIATIAAEAGAEFVGLWLDAPKAVRRDRVGRRKGDASDATPEIVEAQSARDCGDITWSKIDAAGGPEHVLAAAQQILAKAS